MRPTLRDALPFIAVGLIGGLLLLLSENRLDAWQLLLGPVGVVTVLTVTGIMLWQGAGGPRWLDAMPTYLSLPLLAGVFHVTGGTMSPLVPLIAVPILWTALYGNRARLRVVGGLVAAILLLPVVLIGGETYPWDSLPRPVLWSAIALLIGPAVQQRMRKWKHERDRHLSLAAELQAVLDGSRLAAIIITDVPGTIRTFGVGAERMLGMDADHVVGAVSPLEFHDLDEVRAVAEELGVPADFSVFRELAHREAEARTWTYLCADGERISVRLTLTELHDAEGTLTGYLGVAIDITETIGRQEELAAAKERWEFVVSHMPGTTLLTLDEDLVIGLVAGTSSEAQALTGHEGRSLDGLGTPDNVRRIRELVRQALTGQVVATDLGNPQTGAELEMVVTAMTGQRAETGKREVLVLVRDVSRERRRSRAVIRERDRANQLFQEAPHGIAVLSTTGVVTSANPALCLLTGLPESRLVGRPLQELGQDPEDRQVTDHVARLRQPGDRMSTRWALRAADGSVRHVALSSSVIADDPSQPELGTDAAAGAAAAPEHSVLMHVVDVSDQERYESQLAYLANHDSLSGLLNRRAFENALEDHLERCRRYGGHGAVLMLDLDHFKEVNDTMGHLAGDWLIVRVTDLLRRRLRSSDVVARLGGDEFAVLLIETDAAGAERVAADIVEQIRKEMAGLSGAQRRVTASIGVVLTQGQLTASDVMSTVDMLLYDAKDAGRDGFAMLDPADAEAPNVPRTAARIQWTEEIDQALREDRFELFLQPILDISTGQVTNAEALLRMRIDGRLVPPGDFLSVAERSGMIVRIDEWVVRQGVELLARLQRVLPGFQMELNLSGRSVGEPSIELALAQALEQAEVDPHGLVIEITETAAVTHIDAAQDFSRRVGALGCSFALDDFGAGFGSFYYLKHLAFDFVKIDGEFVMSSDVNATDRTLLGSINGLADKLGKQTIAEFVATESILEVVRAEGVDFAQGYHVGRPVPAEEFLAWLAAGGEVDGSGRVVPLPQAPVGSGSAPRR